MNIIFSFFQNFEAFLITLYCWKIIELVEQSKGWSSVEASTGENAENVMMNVSEEELYNLPTADYVHKRRGFLRKELTVYHVAFHAFTELKNVQVDFLRSLVISWFASLYENQFLLYHSLLLPRFFWCFYLSVVFLLFFLGRNRLWKFLWRCLRVKKRILMSLFSCK